MMRCASSPYKLSSQALGQRILFRAWHVASESLHSLITCRTGSNVRSSLQVSVPWLRSQPFCSQPTVSKRPPRAAIFVPEHSPRSTLLKALSRTGNSFAVIQAAGLLRRNSPRVLNNISYAHGPSSRHKPPAAYNLYAQHYHKHRNGCTDSVLQPYVIEAAWQQLGASGRSPFKQNKAEARALLGTQFSSSNIIEPYMLMTPDHELAVVTAAHSQRPPSGFLEFHNELTLAWQRSRIKPSFSVFSQVVSVQWGELLPEEREVYSVKAGATVRKWREEREELGAWLKACDHRATFDQTLIKPARNSRALKLYTSKLPHALAAAVASHSRRSPNGYTMFLEESASKTVASHFIRHRNSRISRHTTAVSWKSMSGEERKPYVDREGVQGSEAVGKGAHVAEGTIATCRMFTPHLGHSSACFTQQQV